MKNTSSPKIEPLKLINAVDELQTQLTRLLKVTIKNASDTELPSIVRFGAGLGAVTSFLLVVTGKATQLTLNGIDRVSTLISNAWGFFTKPQIKPEETKLASTSNAYSTTQIYNGMAAMPHAETPQVQSYLQAPTPTKPTALECMLTDTSNIVSTLRRRRS